MGCDIHLYVEARENGVWVEKKGDFYDGRNYNLFSVLAGVRNRHEIIPICEPRGLPEDVSESVREDECYDHSHSWLTLAELMAFDWTQTATLSGFVNGPEFYCWSGYKRERWEGPDSYCQGVGGGNTMHVSEAEMVRLIDEATKGLNYGPARQAVEALNYCYCRVEWKCPYWRFASDFLGSTMPQLWRLGSPEDVRIVFWFDN